MMEKNLIYTNPLQKSYFQHLKKQEICIPSASIHEIDVWLKQRSDDLAKNSALLVSGTSGCGKSTLLVKWIELYTQSVSSSNEKILFHFVGLQSAQDSLYSTLYHLILVLKESFKLNVKIEYNSQRILQLFGNVLEMVDAHQKMFENKKKMLIVVVDGVDKLDMVSEFFDFLPSKTSSSVKIVYSCNRDTEIYRYLKGKLENEISAESMDPSNKFSLTVYYSRNYLDFPGRILKDIKRFGIAQNALYLKVLYNCLFSACKGVPVVEIASLDSFRTVQSLFEYCVEVFFNFYKKIYKLFGYLAVSYSGIPDHHISKLAGPDSFTYLKFFSFLTFRHENRTCLTNSCFKTIILQKFFPNPSKLHTKLSDLLEASLPETTTDLAYSIFHSKDMTRLKLLISKVTIFTQLFEKENKLDLFQYWHSLHSHKIDSVDCYSKSLESFSNINQLPPQDLSILLLLFSTFFKELSEFEDNDRVKFRHPLLSGHFELREIDLFDEFQRLGNLISSSNEDKKLKDPKVQVKKPRTRKMYNLKRWLWIQFPWCSLDVHSNFSQIMQMLENEPEKHEKEFFDSISRIVKSSGLAYTDFKFKTTESKLTTSMSTTHTRPVSRLKKLFVVNESSGSLLNSSLKLPQKTMVMSSSLFRTPESSSYLSFSGIHPGNSLEYVQNNFIKFSKNNIIRRHQDSMHLQRKYNEKVQEYRMKKSQLESISSQIDYSNTEIMAQEQSIKKIDALQDKLKDMCKKMNKAEAEGLRYKQIIGTCFKNPAKNDECERSLYTKIENIRKTIESEKKNIELHKSETFEINSQLAEFQNLCDSKLKAQHKTFEIVLEQFLMKVKLNEQIVNEDAQREKIVNGEYEPNNLNFSVKFKENKGKVEKFKSIKNELKAKLKKFKQAFEKLGQVAEVTEATDLDFILLRMNNKEQLNEKKNEIEEKLRNLEDTKNSLASKLEYLKKQEYKYRFFNVSEKIENLVDLQKNAEKKLEKFYKLTASQEIILTTCKGILRKIGYPVDFKRKSMLHSRPILF